MLLLMRWTGEKKKRLLRDIHLRAIDAEAREQQSKEQAKTTAETEPSQVVMSKEVPAQISKGSQGSDLAPTTTIEIEKPDAPTIAQLQQRVRKVRTMFPFDLSNPFQFRGTELSRTGPNGEVDPYPEHLDFKTRTSNLKRTFPG